ncbi:hypothetical protein WJU23_09435 [Prosthecobacter sp. SYSU 5D2]|uniref:hypothetical protein n=1 Tax=Prosthecobacter sp. SYSU 5D2 TaxID=3134134 RepID=UPI0031FE5BAB
MAVLNRHARLLYLLALFQLLGGPIVLGGLMMVMKLTAEKEMTLSQSVAHTLERMAHFEAEADAIRDWNEDDSLPPAKPEPKPRKAKDSKDKLWAVNDLGKVVWAKIEPLKVTAMAWHDPVPRKLANAPPLPPPRAV